MSRILLDEFSQKTPYGEVIGSQTTDGQTRLGQDVEQVIAIDNHALRISPLIKSGWNRAGIAYGPYQRKNGLTFSTLILNGHNTSQADALSERFPKRIKRWLQGHHPRRVDMLPRSLQWLLHGDKRAHWRRMRWWWYLSHNELPNLKDNLALGCFSTSTPDDPCDNASAIVMRATGSENGELCIQTGDALVPVIRGIHNIPIYYAIVLRETGAAYYVASLPVAHGMAPFPEFRPIGIDTQTHNSDFYPGIYQSVMGQIGFRAETRIHSVQIDEVESLANWYGTAHVADKLTGLGSLADSPAEIGGGWLVPSGQFIRTAKGTVNTEPDSAAWIIPDTQSGLIRLQFMLQSTDQCDLKLLWRKEQQNQWQLHLDSNTCHLQIQDKDGLSTVSSAAIPHLKLSATHDIQILDDGHEMRIILNGHLLFVHHDARLANGTGIGFHLSQERAGMCLMNFEAHPRAVHLPLDFACPLPAPKKGQHMILCDDFSDETGELHGRPIPNSTKIWKKQVGKGTFSLDGKGSLQVNATVQSPNPGRTAYLSDWDHLDFAELEAEIMPPGTARGQGEAGRAGFIIMENPQRYLIVNTWLDDAYDGTSISSFFQINEFEELYDAVWTNIGRRITWGKPYRLRMRFDGIHYCVYIDDVPVLYRALTDIYPDARPIQIKQVGLVANWEWGNDTGSNFRHFWAKI